MNGLLNSINGFSFISFLQMFVQWICCPIKWRPFSFQREKAHYRYVGFINFCGINAEANLYYHPHKYENVPPPHTIFSGVEKSLFKNA